MNHFELLTQPQSKMGLKHDELPSHMPNLAQLHRVSYVGTESQICHPVALYEYLMHAHFLLFHLDLLHVKILKVESQAK